MSISFGCAPQNVKLIASALDEINKLKTTGPSQVNIDKFKAKDQSNIETALKTNNFWLSYLLGQLQNREDMDQLDNYSKELNEITPSAVKDMAA